MFHSVITADEEAPVVPSFVVDRDFWVVPRTDDYATDCAIGRHLAGELADYIRMTDDCCLLGAVMQAIIARGVYSGVEIGFCAGLSGQLM